MEKLVKLMDTLRVQHGSVLGIDAQLKKKELQLTLYQFTEHLCSSGLHMHKDFPNYVGQVIDVVLQVCDSQDANVRMAGDESLTRILKATVGLHANRILVELCRRIKKNGSVRVMKLTLTRFSDLCHLIRPQKRRAYVANMLNTILLVAKRSEEGIHESLSSFLAKVMPILGVYAYENEIKALLKAFLNNLSSESTIIRRCASHCIAAIAQNSRKNLASIGLVVDYLIDLINPNGDQANVNMVLLGSFMTMRLLLSLSLQSKESESSADSGIQASKLLQIFELCLHYSLSHDHNIATAALETLQQFLKCATPSTVELLKATANHQASATTLANTKTSSNWNLAPLTTGDESHLLENEVSLDVFATSQSHSSEGYMPDFLTSQDVPDSIPAEWTKEPVAADESSDVLTGTTATESADRSETNSAATVEQVMDIGTLWESPSALLYCGRHLACHFLLTAEKHGLKSDRLVRVAVKNLAMSCLSLTGLFEPSIWNAALSKPDQSNSVMIIDVLQYADHPDPQLRGQCAFLAASIIKCLSLNSISTTTFEQLCSVLKGAVRDKAAVTCRLALQGIRLCLPFVAEHMAPSRAKAVAQLTFEAVDNPYWLVKVELLELIGEVPWMFVLEENDQRQSWECMQEEVFRLVYIQSLGNEDQRVRNAAAQSLVSFVRNRRNLNYTGERIRIQNFMHQKLPQVWGDWFVAGVQTSADNVAKVLLDEAVVPFLESNLKEVVQRIVTVLVSSDCRFTKIGCIQALSTLCEVYPPSSHTTSYDCGDSGGGFIHLALSLMTSSHLMLDISVHQALLSLTCNLFAGNVKAALKDCRDQGERSENLPFLTLESAEQASSLLSHVAKLMCSFSTAMEELHSPAGSKQSLVNLPSPSVLSPIRRKTKSGERPEEKSDEFLRKWNKLGSSGASSSLGFFHNNPLYVKLHHVIRTHYSSYKRTFDPVTCDKFVGFLRITLETLALLLEVATFYDVGRYSEELLGYLKVLINLEPQGALFAVQQLLKCLFGVNLACLWEEDTFKRRSESDQGKHPVLSRTFMQLCLGSTQGKQPATPAKSGNRSPSKYRNSSPEKQAKNKMVTKFRTAGRLGPDKSSLSSYIRIFEPMVIRALKLYTTTSCAEVQQEVLNLLSELVHLCVNYCLLDADQVFLNFVIQQLEFLEEGFIVKVETLLPAIFRFLCLLSYDRYHSKSVIAIPRIIRICGGLIATGKDPELYVLPALGPIVEDLFLSKERLEDRSQELDTEREVLISMMLRLIKYHKVYPLLLTVIDRTRSESTVKWNSLSKQICDSLIPVVHAHEADIDDVDALHVLSELLCNLASSAVHESLLGLLQTFSPAAADTSFVQVLAARCAVLEYLLTAYDEPFLLDCLGEFNLNYLVNQSTDPLNVTVDALQPQFVLASVLVANLKMTVAEIQKLKEATFTESGPWTADRSTSLERVASHYVLRLVRLMDSGAFPEIGTAFNLEIADEEFLQGISGHLKCIADFSPALVIQVAVLVPHVLKLLLMHMASKPGLNCAIATTGLLIVSCIQQSKNIPTDEETLQFWRDHGRTLLEALDEPQVFEYAVSVLEDPRKSDGIFETFTLPLSVTEMFSYLRLYEAASLGSFQKQTVSLLRRINNSKDVILCNRTCDVVCSRIVSQGHLPAEEMEEILEITSTSKQLASIEKTVRRLIGKDRLLCTTPLSQKDLAKDWALHFLCQSDSLGLSSKETSMLISSLELELLERLFADLGFVHKLLKSKLHPKDVPKFVLALKPTLFRQIATVSDVSQMAQIADILKRTFDLTLNWKTALQFTAGEIKLLTEFVFSLLSVVASMDPAESCVTVSLCAGIFQTNRDVVEECGKAEHASRLYSAVHGLMGLLSCWTSCLKIPAFCEVLRSMETLSSNEEFVACTSNLAAMFDWLEHCQGQSEIPAKLLKPLRVVLCTICRLPFFYSFLLVPSSVWEKDWNPVTSLDPNSLRFEVPVVPAHFLQDELTLKQFIFRIRTLGWISRQKFEEIWMSVLGVLSLRNEPEMREEELHCITLVTCQAVKTLTVLLEQNILTPGAGNPVCRKYLHISRDPHLRFFTTEKGEKLRRVFEASRLLGNCDSVNLERLHSNRPPEYGLGQLSREYIDSNLRSSSNSFQQLTNIDLESCVHFMVDLYMQWLHDAETPYALVLDIFRSLLIISDFFTDSIHFLWLLEQSLVFHKRILPEDPLCLEPALIGCVLKSAAFVQMDPETWEDVRKVTESALISSNVATRRTALHGILYVLQKYARKPDNMDPSSLLNLVMDYVTKYLGSENPGLEWHQSLLWASAFYCAENFASFQYRSDNIVDCVVQFAVNALLDSKSISLNMQCTILQGLERLCLGERLTSGTRRIINKEIVNMVRNVNKPQLFEPSLRILLSLMYTDLPMMKEDNPTSDPETMLAAMEWIGVLFHRLKTGNDAECGLLSDVLVSVVPDILPAADILNRLLAEFMSAEARVAKFVVPTLFQVFQNARAEGQQSMVLEWILLSLSNFTRICGSSASMGAWNICCLLAAASANHWLKILFPFVSQPIDTDNVYESQLFVTAVLDFSSQLGAEQKKSLVAIFHSAKDNSPLYLTAADLLVGGR